MTPPPPGDSARSHGRRADPVTHRAIYAIVRRIPRGRVSTYGRVAALARCRGARQVGYALHGLPEGTTVPWHRVVNARGAVSLPGDAGTTQRLRLAREGIGFDARGRIDLTVQGWPPAARRRS